MAAKLLAASGAISTSGNNTRVLGLILTAAGGVGTAVVKTGGSGGSAVTPTFSVLQNDTVQLDLRGMHVIGDYVTLTNMTALVEFHK